jgi:hypothetical protein
MFKMIREDIVDNIPVTVGITYPAVVIANCGPTAEPEGLGEVEGTRDGEILLVIS